MSRVYIIEEKNVPKNKLKLLYDLENEINNFLRENLKIHSKISFDPYIYIIPNQHLYGLEPQIIMDGVHVYYLNFPEYKDAKLDAEFRKNVVLLDHFLKNESISLKLIIENFDKLSLVVSFDREINFQSISPTKKGELKAEESEYFINYEPIDPLYSFEQLVLPETTLSEIKKTLTILKLRKTLYEDWGFNSVEPSPRAIINFYGPPGTGKTMTAHAIANYLNMKILIVNYADVESKFVGDAPKNLIRVFRSAEQKNAILFFDEADSFLGRRITSVSTSADQAVNSLRSQMLMLLESFSGIVIFATNLLKNYDRAFESRIFKHIKFELPDKEMRIQMIRKMIPAKVPLKEDLDQSFYETLAEISEGFSGRDIKNAIRDALVSALHEGSIYVEKRHFIGSFELYKKQKIDVETEMTTQMFNSVENKIKDEMNKINTHSDTIDESLIFIILHALWADDEIKDEEEELINKISKLLGKNIELKRKEDLPPIEDLTKNITDKKDKIKALELVMNILCVDGDINDKERLFLNKLINNFQIVSTYKNTYFNTLEKCTEFYKNWNLFRKEFLNS